MSYPRTLLGSLLVLLLCAALGAAGSALAANPVAPSVHRPSAGRIRHPAKRRTELAHRGRSACHRRLGRDTARCGSRLRKLVVRGIREPHAPRPTSSSSPLPSEATQTPAVMIAKVIATPCQNTNLMPEAENLALVRAAVLCLINKERAQNNEQPLRTNGKLENAAQSHGREMISLDYFGHVSPSGMTPVARIMPTGYVPSSEDGYVIGENLAWGTLSLATPQAIAAAWIASPEHLANILESRYRDTGIDVQPAVPSALAEGAPGALYTQEFGVIIR